MNNIEQTLAHHPFLQGMRQAHIQAIADCGRLMSVTPGSFLAQEKQAADSFYLLLSGRVAIEIHSPARGGVRIQTLGAGELVGWSWLVPPHRWQFDARVIETVHAVAVDARCLRGKCEVDHELGYQFLQRLVTVIASRLTATRLQLLDVYR